MSRTPRPDSAPGRAERPTKRSSRPELAEGPENYPFRTVTSPKPVCGMEPGSFASLRKAGLGTQDRIDLRRVGFGPRSSRQIIHRHSQRTWKVANRKYNCQGAASKWNGTGPFLADAGAGRGDSKGKGAALALPALHGNLAAVCLHQLLDDGQAQARAAVAP